SMVIADLNENMGDNFLWDQERIKKISSVMSNSFKAIRSRHRGGLYSDLIERLKKKEERYFPYFENPNYFKYPFIL
ncbi:MAG: hypothetical protein KAR07_08060, partial [Spirochaetes bacterium]|nr:hypothetical protein [Spirochaetota bacterium]